MKNATGMRTHLLVLIVCTAIVGVASVMVAAAIADATDQKPAAPAAVVSRYSGVLSVAAPTGAAARPLRVEIKDWQMVRTPQGVQVPAAGFYIAQLKSGEIDTEIAGKKEHRQAGDFWTVAAGESMTITFPPHSQSAQIQTVLITPGAGTH
jgi:hypothetical protein